MTESVFSFSQTSNTINYFTLNRTELYFVSLLPSHSHFYLHLIQLNRFTLSVFVPFILWYFVLVFFGICFFFIMMFHHIFSAWYIQFVAVFVFFFLARFSNRFVSIKRVLSGGFAAVAKPYQTAFGWENKSLTYNFRFISRHFFVTLVVFVIIFGCRCRARIQYIH